MGGGPEKNIPERVPAYSAANMQEVDDNIFKTASIVKTERVDQEAVERASVTCGVCGCALCEGKENKTGKCEKSNNDGCDP
jgi:hypothetical protein